MKKFISKQILKFFLDAGSIILVGDTVGFSLLGGLLFAISFIGIGLWILVTFSNGNDQTANIIGGLVLCTIGIIYLIRTIKIFKSEIEITKKEERDSSSK